MAIPTNPQIAPKPAVTKVATAMQNVAPAGTQRPMTTGQVRSMAPGQWDVRNNSFAQRPAPVATQPMPAPQAVPNYTEQSMIGNTNTLPQGRSVQANYAGAPMPLLKKPQALSRLAVSSAPGFQAPGNTDAMQINRQIALNPQKTTPLLKKPQPLSPQQIQQRNDFISRQEMFNPYTSMIGY